MASISGLTLLARGITSLPRNQRFVNFNQILKLKSVSSFSKRALSINFQNRFHMKCLTYKKIHELKSQSFSLQECQKRSIWSLDSAFNKVDKKKVRLAGADRVCAEWVLKNGGSIKWKGSDIYLANYNALPTSDFASFNVEEIDLTGTDVTDQGFLHLKNLQHVKLININGVKTIQDKSLHHLRYVADTLEHLQVSHCPQITQTGLEQLQNLTNLKKVILYDLPVVKDLDGAISHLKETMPWCQFETS